MGESPFRNMPKVELHVHLDCSLSYDVVSKIDPGISHAEFLDEFVAPPKCRDLAHFLTYANRQIVLLQTEQNLRLAVKDLVRQFKQDNVIYAEIRFSPHLHTSDGLTPFEVVNIVDSEMDKWADLWNIELGLILCTLRHYNRKQSLETAELANYFKDRRVKGFDIAGDEAGYPLTNHVEAFAYARSNNINTTCHAGEASGADSVEESLTLLKSQRVGHGVRSVEDEDVVNKLKDKRIHLEVCPSTNIQVNVFQTFSDHPIDKLKRQGIPLNINTDTRTITNTTLNREYEKVQKAFGWTLEDFRASNMHALDAAFIDNVTRKQLQKQLLESFEAIVPF